MADRLLYATPTGRHPKPEYVCSLRALELTCRSFRRAAADYQLTDGPVQIARSRIAEKAMRDGYDFVLMHDDDLMVLPAEKHGNPLDVWHRIFNENPEVGMIGAVYLREYPAVPNVAVSHTRYPDELAPVVAGFPDEPMFATAVGTGFVMIRTAALRAIRAAEEPTGAPGLFRFETNQTRWGFAEEVGEDYWFCLRLAKAGYKLLVDPRFPTIHCKDSGRLTFAREEWERAWNTAGPLFEATAAALKTSNPGLTLAVQNGYLVLDQIAQREGDGAAWQSRQTKREAA